MGIFMQKVNSKNVDSVGYGENQTLRIKFKSGAIYDYLQVPIGVFNLLIQLSKSGQSITKALNQHVKDIFPFTRIDNK